MNLITNNKHLESVKASVLLLQVPRTNDKKELAAEQMFASLYVYYHQPISEIVFFPKAEKKLV